MISLDCWWCFANDGGGADDNGARGDGNGNGDGEVVMLTVVILVIAVVFTNGGGGKVWQYSVGVCGEVGMT